MENIKSRSELREVIMKVIYQINIFEEANLDYDVTNLIKEHLEIQNDFVETSINGIIENKKRINDWTIDRLSKVDQAILSLGIYELMYTDIPSVVAINEAVELSKNYSDEAVTKMINGVLDKIYNEEEK